jgi:ABC-type Fe3+-hydroxamate transport system substrate-binding protein
MPLFIDQISRQIEIPQKPQRIISLVPSQTELLYDLGLDTEVIGITKFCIRPEQWFRSKTRIGGTKQLHLDQIISLKPDLIIANKEENLQEQVEPLMDHFPVWVSDIHNLDSALDMINKVGQITGKPEKALAIQSSIKKQFNELSNSSSPQKPKVCYLIWRNPYMTVGSDTFIHDMLTRAGFDNVFADKKRYPTITIDEITDAHCDFLLLSSEPYPFSQKHIDELKSLIPSTLSILVDGELFSWYGSRLLHTPAYLQNLVSLTS